MTTATRTAPDPRKITGWAAADITLSPATLQAMARNPHAAFPVSGDAKPRPAWLVLGMDERRALLNGERQTA